MSKPVLVWIAVGSVLAALVVIGLLLQRRGQRSADAKPPGFREIVRSPALWQQVIDEQGAAHMSTEDAREWSDDRVASAVRRFVLDLSSSADDRGLEYVLKQLGPRTHPAALAILREPGIRERLIVPTGEDLVPEAPFNRLCKLLHSAPPVESIGLLGPYLDETPDEIRQDAALILGESGDVAAVPFLRTALRDEEDCVRTYALMGLRGAAIENRLSEELKRALVDDVERLLVQGPPPIGDAADVLFLLDAERGRAFFLCEERFRPDSPILFAGLERMNALGIDIPRDRLCWLIAQVKTTVASIAYDRERTLTESLRALGRRSKRR